LQQRVDAGQVKPDGAVKLALDLATSAMGGDDSLGAIECLKAYYKYNPSRVDTAKMIADIYYDMRMAGEAVEWYGNYLKAADPAVAGDAYVNAQVDRATMRMQLADKEARPAELTRALDELQQVIASRPQHWAARFNYGQALLQQGDKTAAEQTWNAALKLATNPEEKWRTDAALAALHGQPPPPRPAGTQELASGSAAAGQFEEVPPGVDPHAGMSTPPGTPNPHTNPTFGKGVEGR
jgi:tetratricopeptide (TPR) repeat protein